MRVGPDRARRPVRVSAVVGDPCSVLTVTVETVNEFAILTAKGTLDSSTYGTLRDRILNAALEEPTAVNSARHTSSRQMQAPATALETRVKLACVPSASSAS